MRTKKPLIECQRLFAMILNSPRSWYAPFICSFRDPWRRSFGLSTSESIRKSHEPLRAYPNYDQKLSSAKSGSKWKKHGQKLVVKPMIWWGRWDTYPDGLTSDAWKPPCSIHIPRTSCIELGYPVEFPNSRKFLQRETWAEEGIWTPAVLGFSSLMSGFSLSDIIQPQEQ